MIDLNRYHQTLDSLALTQDSGRVLRAVGLSIVASGPRATLGEVCIISTDGGPQQAVVVGFREQELLLQPLGSLDGIRPGDKIVACGRALDVPVGPAVIGRVLDGVGRPIDGLGDISGQARRPVHGEPPPALGRRPITDIMHTGLKVIDTMTTLGCGQRMGIFAAAGLGKSMLLGELAKHSQADVNVICLVGERGREVSEFIERVLGQDGMQRSVVIAATSDRPAVERLTAAYAAHAIAEHFRDAGLNVLLMMDSLTRFCHAQREIGLANGEPPTVRGFPPSSFALLPGLLERAGTGAQGSITGIYTVLVDGDENEDPVAETVRAILDGHLILDRELSERGIYPSVNLAKSVSRLMVDLASPEEWQIANLTRERWGSYQRVRELVEIGAYRQGSDAALDQAIACRPLLEDFLRQNLGENVRRDQSYHMLAAALAGQAPDEEVA